MALETIETLAVLYQHDETAWLDLMAELARDGHADELDLPHLAEYLSDMARRDRLEVESRLVVLMTHLLKWNFQPDHRSRSRRSTVIEQRQELRRLVGRGILLNYAQEVLEEVYSEAVERAASETGLASSDFPSECPFSLDQLLTAELSAEIE